MLFLASQMKRALRRHRTHHGLRPAGFARDIGEIASSLQQQILVLQLKVQCTFFRPLIVCCKAQFRLNRV
jgi:hypothetical protein